MPTWLLRAPSDTRLLAKSKDGGSLGGILFKQIKPWLDFFNANTSGSNLRTIAAPLDTRLPVKDSDGKVIGYVPVKDNKPWSDFFNSEGSEATPPPALDIVTASPLPDADVAELYAVVLIAEGGVQPYTWTLDSGTLPTGLTLSSEGLISGTPTGGGTFTFTVMVTDDDGTEVEKEFTIDAVGSTIFTDDFNRADTVNGYGSNWLRSAYGQLPGAFSQVDQIRIVSNGACLGASALNFLTTDVTCIFPIPPLYSLQSISQFAECLFVSQNNTGDRIMLVGPAVAADWGPLTATTNGYVLAVENDNGINTGLKMRRANSAITTLATLSAIDLPDNTVLRLEVTFGVGSNTIRSYVAGVLVSTVVDSDAARPTFGAPALCLAFITRTGAAGAASQTIFDNFSCGSV